MRVGIECNYKVCENRSVLKKNILNVFPTVSVIPPVHKTTQTQRGKKEWAHPTENPEHTRPRAQTGLHYPPFLAEIRGKEGCPGVPCQQASCHCICTGNAGLPRGTHLSQQRDV